MEMKKNRIIIFFGVIALLFLIIYIVLVYIGYEKNKNSIFPDKLEKGFKRVKDLRIGDALFTRDKEKLQEEKIINISKKYNEQKVYNLKLRSFPATYFADKFAVHNKGGCDQSCSASGAPGTGLIPGAMGTTGCRTRYYLEYNQTTRSLKIVWDCSYDWVGYENPPSNRKGLNVYEYDPAQDKWFKVCQTAANNSTNCDLGNQGASWQYSDHIYQILPACDAWEIYYDEELPISGSCSFGDAWPAVLQPPLCTMNSVVEQNGNRVKAPPGTASVINNSGFYVYFTSPYGLTSPNLVPDPPTNMPNPSSFDISTTAPIDENAVWYRWGWSAGVTQGGKTVHFRGCNQGFWNGTDCNGGTQCDWEVNLSVNPEATPTPTPTATPIPTATPTPYIKINVKNSAGIGTTVTEIGFTYLNNSGLFALADGLYFVASGIMNVIAGKNGGGGVDLGSSQRYLGITPAAGSEGGSESEVVWGGETYYNYWWPSYISTGFKELTYIVGNCPNCPTNPLGNYILRTPFDGKYNLDLSWTDISAGEFQEGGYTVSRYSSQLSAIAEYTVNLASDTETFLDTNDNAGFACGVTKWYEVSPVTTGCDLRTCTRFSVSTQPCASLTVYPYNDLNNNGIDDDSGGLFTTRELRATVTQGGISTTFTNAITPIIFNNLTQYPATITLSITDADDYGFTGYKFNSDPLTLLSGPSMFVYSTGASNLGVADRLEAGVYDFPRYWFQGRQGDMHANSGGISDRISMNASEQFILGLHLYAGYPNTAGIISANFGIDHHLSTGKAQDPDDWQMQNYSAITNGLPNYAELRERAGGDNIPRVDCSAPGYKVLTQTSDMVVECTSGLYLEGSPYTGIRTIFIPGNLSIDRDIFTDPRSNGVMFVVSGNLYIASAVRQLEAYFVVDGDFENNTSTVNRLMIYGGLAVKGDIALQRTVAPDSLPSEYFVYNPFYISHYANILGKYNTIWKEVDG